MFLTRLTLHPEAARSEAFWRAFADPYAAHQEVWRWAGGGAEASRDFLYRIDTGTDGRPQVLVLAPRPAAAPADLWRSEHKPWAPAIEAGQTLTFRLRANAVVRQGHVRHDAVMHAVKEAGRKGGGEFSRAEIAQTAGGQWLRAQAQDRGFDVEGVLVTGHQVVNIGRGGRGIRLGVLDLDGRLVVRDPARLVEAVKAGFGPAKGFGYGLMLLRPE